MTAALRERAAEAWEIESNRRDQADADNAQELYNAAAELFFDTFGTAPDGGTVVSDNDHVILSLGDLRFTVEPRDYDGFRLMGLCPNCGEDCNSQAIKTTEKLGEMIEAFKPGFAHTCALPTNSESLTKALMGNTLDYAHSAKAILADALSTLNIIEGNHRGVKRVLARLDRELSTLKTVLGVELWEHIDPKDPVTGRSNKDWAQKQLEAQLAGMPQISDRRIKVAEFEEDEAAIVLELGRAKLAVKLADLEWRYSMAEVRARTALLTFSEGL